MINIGVEQIEQMERGALIALWQELIDKPLPRHTSIVFLKQDFNKTWTKNSNYVSMHVRN